MARSALRIVVIAPLRFPIRRPHAGGLESAVWNEVQQLKRRGHDVTLIAPEGSDDVESGSPFAIPALEWPDGMRRTDTTYPDSLETRSLPALDAALSTIAADPDRFDVISNHCLHSLPVRRAGELGVPMISTLHTPVDPDVVHAHAAASGMRSRFLAVSEHTRRTWAASGIDATVLPNAVDPLTWLAGAGGDELVWFGRLVPEKAPHVAIEIAERLGRPLVLAGRIGDQSYADEFVRPRLNDRVRYAGELDPTQLARLVGASACSIATPAWEEPFGLVAPESLMCGTPVASFATGGVTEIAVGSIGMTTAAAGDVAGLAAAVEELARRSTSDPAFRIAVHESALARYSLDSRVAALEEHFLDAMHEQRDARERAA